MSTFFLKKNCQTVNCHHTGSKHRIFRFCKTALKKTAYNASFRSPNAIILANSKKCCNFVSRLRSPETYRLS